MSRSPFSVGTFKKLYTDNLKVLTRTASKAMGQTFDDLGPSNLNRVAQSLGNTFDDIGRQIKSVPVDPAMSRALKDSLPTLTARKFTAQVATGRLTGREYLKLRSKLGEVARGTSPRADEASALIDALDDSVANVTPKALQAAYAKVREQWRVLIAMEKYQHEIKGGLVQPSQAFGALRNIFNKSFSRNTGKVSQETQDLFDVVRALNDPRMKAAFGDSGTAQNLAALAAPTIPAAAAAMDPTAGALAAAGIGTAMLAPRVLLGAPGGGQVGGAIGRSILAGKPE